MRHDHKSPERTDILAIIVSMNAPRVYLFAFLVADFFQCPYYLIEVV